MIGLLCCSHWPTLTPNLIFDPSAKKIFVPSSTLNIWSGSIDLLHPADPETLRSEVAPYYAGTAHRKSMVAMRACLKEASDAAALQILNAVKEQKPADGPALVKLILDMTKFDLTKNLSN